MLASIDILALLILKLGDLLRYFYTLAYGFRQPRGNEIKDVGQILVLQAVYSAAKMEAFKALLTQLFIQEVQQHKAVWGHSFFGLRVYTLEREAKA